MRKFQATVEVIVAVQLELHATDLAHAVERAAVLAGNTDAQELLNDNSWNDSEVHVRGVDAYKSSLYNG